MLGPTREVLQPCASNGLTGEQVAALNSGSSRLYVYGKATYRDVFGEERHTMFCTWWDVARTGLDACATCNDADQRSFQTILANPSSGPHQAPKRRRPAGTRVRRGSGECEEGDLNPSKTT